MKYSLNKHFNFLLFVIITDFFTDGIAYTLNLNLSAGDPFIKYFITFNFIFLYIVGIKKIPFRLTYLWLPFYLILIVIFYGFLRGLFTSKFVNNFNDTSSYIAIFLILVIINFKFSNTEYIFQNYFKVLIWILSIKLIIFQFLSIAVYGIPSWKMLLKQHALLLIPFSVYSYEYFSKNKKNIILFLLTTFLLILAVARMLFISMIFILFINIIRTGILKSIFKLLAFTFFLFLLFQLFLFTQSVSQDVILDILYGGKIYEGGMDYRFEQFAVIKDRYLHYPILGVGFGFYTPNYLTYGELAKPYLLELDFLNFISKIGFLFSFLYATSYLFLLYIILKLKNIRIKNFYISLFIALISLIIYSIGQTFHQSYLFWIFYSLLYGFVIIDYKKYNIHSL